MSASLPRPFDSSLERCFIGEGGAVAGDYLALLPSDTPLPRPLLTRAWVADILQRHGLVADEDTLDKLIAQAEARPAGESGGPDYSTFEPGAWGVHEDAAKGSRFAGHVLPVSATAQRTLTDEARAELAREPQTSPAQVNALIADLRGLADTAGRQDIVKTLDAVKRGIDGGRKAEAEGAPAGEVALRGMLEFASGMGREREAAKILERYTAIKGLSGSVRELAMNARRVFGGFDPATGKPINTDQRVDAAFDLLRGGFKLAGEIGTTAMLMGARATGLAGSLIAIAPVGLAIVAFAAAAYELIKRTREALLAPRWDEFRERFPFAEGIEPRHAMTRVLRLIGGMPDGPDNAATTAQRILALFGENPETRERYLAFLKQKVAPESLVDALADGKLARAVSSEDAVRLARAAKENAREFLDLEMRDVKRYLREHDDGRVRGAYLAPNAGQARNDDPMRQWQGDLREAARVGVILSSGAHALNGLFQNMLSQLKQPNGAAPGGLDAQQQKNLAAAAVPALRDAGITRVDHLLASKDGARLFAVQGDPHSEHRRIASIDIGAGIGQSIETSSRLAARQQDANQQDAAQPAPAITPGM
ncbi:hypothetical protein EBB59_05105 [Lysobacter pythonis]|uniref:X-Tfes XVIPCD domain-containing protein n=1 Tax=Solilutibacter pythonis TaxID=2483112 RepID=A0A3M2I465_9GAMM|nr:XVIPCD domain-containing protein [Lysobacter pythonis]RMH93277.1 hypothetical protein EBB59_05105 [Lysobacter pythonis]